MIFSIYVLYTVIVYATVNKRVNYIAPCYLHIATVLINITLHLEGKTVIK